VPRTTGTRPAFNLYNPNVPASQDPLRQIVSLDFQGMDLTNVVSLLAEKGQINVIAGTEVTGTVTANLKNVPLGRAIEIVLRMNGLGIVEEAGVYRITSYEEAVAAQRQTRMIFLQNAQATEVKKTLDDIIGSDEQSQLISVSANPSTNVIIIAGPLESVEQLEGVVSELDVTQQVVPTITMAMKLNYSEPVQLLPVIQPLLSKDGKISADPRTRQLVVTDVPVKVQEIQAMVNTVDLPVRSVKIDAMVVDAQMEDGAQTGIDWILNTNHLQADGDPDFSTGATLPITNPQAGLGMLSWGLISGGINLRAEIQARVESTDSKILAAPTVVTVENQPAEINISREIPYQELTQTSEGGQLATTKFKDVGTVMKVTPRVTHDDHILVNVDAKQSNTTGESVTGVPVEAKRTATTNLRMKDGQSVYIGGLRSFDSTLGNRKVPILGDIPVLNTLFKSQDVNKQHTELLIFLTCNVMPDENYPDLTPYEAEKFGELGGLPHKINGTRDLVRTYTHPEEQRDPVYKWRRTN
jgi:type II secretory pathway component HofQ